MNYLRLYFMMMILNFTDSLVSSYKYLMNMAVWVEQSVKSMRLLKTISNGMVLKLKSGPLLSCRWVVCGLANRDQKIKGKLMNITNPITPISSVEKNVKSAVCKISMGVL